MTFQQMVHAALEMCQGVMRLDDTISIFNLTIVRYWKAIKIDYHFDKTKPYCFWLQLLHNVHKVKF